LSWWGLQRQCPQQQWRHHHHQQQQQQQGLQELHHHQQQQHPHPHHYKHQHCHPTEGGMRLTHSSKAHLTWLQLQAQLQAAAA
jgi:hypothetical protein